MIASVIIKVEDEASCYVYAARSDRVIKPPPAERPFATMGPLLSRLTDDAAGAAAEQVARWMDYGDVIEEEIEDGDSEEG